MSNLACRFIVWGINRRNVKLGQRGQERGHVTYFCNVSTPSISRELLELQTSNLACRFITRSINEKNKIMLNGSKGVGKGSRDLLLKFWHPVWMTFGRQMLNHVEKQQILL